jgi:hypothetical protein
VAADTKNKSDTSSSQHCAHQWSQRFTFSTHLPKQILKQTNIACTLVITEISYHEKPGYKANVEFLSKGSWKKEFDVLLADIRDNLNDTKLKKPAAGTHAQPPGLQVRSKEAQRSWDTVCFVFCLSFKMTTTALSHLNPSSISRSYPRTIGRHH